MESVLYYYNYYCTHTDTRQVKLETAEEANPLFSPILVRTSACLLKKKKKTKYHLMCSVKRSRMYVGGKVTFSSGK